MCRCPLARMLWEEMAAAFSMPCLDSITNSSTEWALLLLNDCPEEQWLPVLMTFLANWYVWNEVVHHKSAPTIEAFCRFLCIDIDSLRCIEQHPHGDIMKGKMVLSLEPCRSHTKAGAMPASCSRPPERWTKPPVGWNKLNIDGAWREDGTGGAGMILRDCDGTIIYSSRRFLRSCISPLEAEVVACMEGIALTLDWSTSPFILETDSLVAANMINEPDQNRSRVVALICEIKRLLLLGREHVVLHVSRSRNKVSH
uniref:RNase H type-1 domain-containing protein n=1 Tax=Triticum urartu TaxID=4572 RepID=A0A8R7VGV1_TRIUA